MISIETEAETPPSYELFKMQDDLEPATVRGVAGWYTSRRDPISGTTSSAALFWREPSGVVVNISSADVGGGGGALSKDDLISIANGLTTASAADWQAFAEQAESTGTGIGELAGPIQVAFPTAPTGYQLDSAHLDDSQDPYGTARYVPVDQAQGLPIIEVRLRAISPEDWARWVESELAGHERSQANGRTLIETSPGLNGGNAGARSAAFEWVTNVVVELVAYMPDNSPVSLAFTDVAALANQVNGVSFFER